MNFKEQLQQDLKIFLNTAEFADIHTIDGVATPALIDTDLLRERSDNEHADGVFFSRIVLFVETSVLGYQPIVGNSLNVDGDLYFVLKCADVDGLYRIELGANES
ncbi:hypothetical protein BTO30_14900 [Domibacillus antri]|uniref:Uncharacterized protein n=1 Tax=Domibacillus antri TaxID=1714264 RepID=A0A1Q8Q238_9BACI|nr:hypothetical protein [Domibacillus antri]OLN21406.1 hypothetical protein BTO30_14900 [Domibacillus antri]